METHRQLLQRRVEVLQALLRQANEPQQKALFERGLANARQMLVNFCEVERLLSGGPADHSPSSGKP